MKRDVFIYCLRQELNGVMTSIAYENVLLNGWNFGIAMTHADLEPNVLAAYLETIGQTVTYTPPKPLSLEDLPTMDNPYIFVPSTANGQNFVTAMWMDDGSTRALCTLLLTLGLDLSDGSLDSTYPMNIYASLIGCEDDIVRTIILSTALLALVGTLLTGVMLVKKWKGAILLGIFVTWALGMLAQASGIYVPDPAKGFFSTYPSFTIGDVANSFKEFGSTIGAVFKSESWTHTVKGEVVGSGWPLVTSLDFFVVMFAFFFMDLFDTLGTLIGVSLKGGFLDKNGRLPRISGALCADSIATSVGALLGTSTTTTYVESASGVAVGGKTGLTAVTAAALFALAILFAPIFLAVPGFATTPALIIVGYMMISSCADIEWRDAGEAVPAFLSITAMPFTYSISDSIMFGVISYTVINALAGNFRRIHWIMYVLTAIFIAKYALM